MVGTVYKVSIANNFLILYKTCVKNDSLPKLVFYRNPVQSELGSHRRNVVVLLLLKGSFSVAVLWFVGMITGKLTAPLSPRVESLADTINCG